MLNAVIEKLDVLGDVFSLGADEKLDGERERVNQGGIGIDGGILFFVGEETKVNGGGLKNQSHSPVLEVDQVIFNRVDIKMFLSAGFNIAHMLNAFGFGLEA